MNIIDWKLMVKFISLPVMLYQIIYLIYDYLLFSTLIRVEFPEYDIKDWKYSSKEFPAITMCTENIFEQLFFDTQYPNYYYNDLIIIEDIENLILKLKIKLADIEKSYKSTGNKKFYQRQKNIYEKLEKYSKIYLKYTKLLKSSISNILVRNLIFGYITDRQQKIYQKAFDYYDNNNNKIDSEYYISTFLEYFSANNREEFLNKSDVQQNIDMNRIQEIEKFYRNHTVCEQINLTLKWISPLGICHTYDSNGTDRINYFTSIKLEQMRMLNFKTPNYLNKKYYLHEPEELPKETEENINIDSNFNYIIKISKSKITNLEWPYSSMCKNYEESSQFECLNQCYHNSYIELLQCIPNTNYHAIFLSNNYSTNEYCQDDVKITEKLKNQIIFKCGTTCRTPCIIHIYDTINEKLLFNQFSFDISSEFKIISNYYQHIINYPKLTIMNLVINIANTLSLWNGTHFFLFMMKAFNIFGFFFTLSIQRFQNDRDINLLTKKSLVKVSKSCRT